MFTILSKVKYTLRKVSFTLEGGVMKNNIRLLRGQFDLTQEQLAEKVKVSRQSIIAIENEKYKPSLELAYKISKVFQLPIEKVFIFEMEE